MLKDWYPLGKGRGAIFGVALFFVFAVGFFVSGNAAYAASAAPSVPAPAAGAAAALPADHLIDVLNKTPGTRGEQAADASAFVGTVKIGGAVLDAARSALQIASLDVLGSVAITATGEQGLRLSLGGGKNDLSIYRDNDVGDWTLLRTDKGNGIGLIGQPDVIALAVSRINGNVGIGTTSPSNDHGWKKVLDVHGSDHAKSLVTNDAGIKVGLFAHNSWDGAAGSVGTESNHPLRFLTNNSEKMRLFTDGNVGIGTTEPVVAGGGFTGIDIRGTNGSSVVLGKSSKKPAFLYSDSAYLNFETPDYIALRPGSSEKMRITSSGNVGIGTTDPGGKLVVALNDATTNYPDPFSIQGVTVLNDSGTQDSMVGLKFSSGVGSAAGIFARATGGDNTDINFWTESGSRSVKMTLKDIGNVGIGTTNPGATLEIAGNKGGAGNRNFKVTYPGGGNLQNTELSGLTHLVNSSDSVDGWTALYAKQGSAAYAGVFNGRTIFMNGNVGIGTNDPTPELSGARLLQIDDEDHAIIGLRSTFPNDTARSDIRMSLGTLSNNEFDRAVIATESAHPLTFNTENKFRVAILSTGEFQIGTANPSSPSALLLAQKDGDDPAASDVFRVQRSSEVRDNRIIPDLTVDDRGVVIVSGDAPNDTDKSVKLFVNGRVDAENYCIKGTTNCVTDFKNIGPWKETGNNIYNENSGNIGIGTAIPNDKLQIGNTFAFHDGGHKLIGFGFNPSNGKALMDGYPAEIRWIPNNTSSSGSALHIGIEDSLRTRGQDVSVWEKWGITLKPGGNVGIGTTNPGTQLSVNGPASFGKVIQNVFKVGPFGNNPGPLFFYINTKIPFTDSPSPQLKITGYNYGNGNRAISFTLSWYTYPANTAFYWSQVQGDIGYYMPSRIRLGTWNDAGTKRIRIEIANDKTYWSSYSISAFDSNGPVSHYEGWTSAEGEFPGDTGNIKTVNHASGVVYTNTGNVGIGTTNPGARLSINTSDSNALDVRGKSDSWLGLLSSNAKNFSGFFSDKDHDVNLALRRGSGDYGVYLRSSGNSYFGGADHTGLWVASPNNKDSYINFYTSDHNRWSIGKYGSSNETYSRGLYFYEDHTDAGTGGGSAGTRMFIAPGGNVGIGTTDFQTGVQGNDNYKLHVQNGAGKSATVSIGRSDGQGGNLRGAGGGLQLVPAHHNGGTWNIVADDNHPVSGNAYLKTWYGGRNILTLVDNGNVGIGMDNPIARLHVRVGESPNYYDGPRGLYIDINEQGTTPVGLAGTKFLQFRNETLDKIVMVVKRDGKTGIGTGNLCPGCQLNVEGGDINVGFFGENRFTELPEKTRVAYETDRVGLDVAELFETEEEVEVGDIVGVANEDRKLIRSSQQYQDTIVGVVSGAPAILFEGSELRMGANPNRFEKGTKPPVALAGRIPVKVSLENGSIKPGDYLTSSSNPGVAMKATEPGMAIGVALEKYNEQSKGDTVLVFLNLGDKNSDVLIKRLESLERRLRAFEFKPRW